MPNIVTALKENKNDFRKKFIITTTVGVGVILTAVVLSKLKDNNVDVIVLSPVEADVPIAISAE